MSTQTMHRTSVGIEIHITAMYTCMESEMPLTGATRGSGMWLASGIGTLSA